MATRRINRIVDGERVESDEEYDPDAEAAAAQHTRMLNEETGTQIIDVLARQPDLAVVYAQIQAIWDQIEHTLLTLFSLLSGMDYTSARRVLFSQQTHAGRRSMIEQLAEHRLQAFPVEKKQLETVLNRVKARAGVRNILIHGIWGSIIENDAVEWARFEVSPAFFSEKHKRYKLSDLRLILTQMIATHEALHSAYTGIATSQAIRAYWAGKSYIP